MQMAYSKSFNSSNVGLGKFFLELNSKRLYQSLGKEKESRRLAFMSSTKREIRHFHVVVVQKKGDARAKLLFCQSKLPIAFIPVLTIHRLRSRIAVRVGTIIYPI